MMADTRQIFKQLNQVFKEGMYETYLERIRVDYQNIMNMDESLQDIIFEMRDTAAMHIEK